MNTPSQELQLHYAAMWRLVSLRGGLEKISLQGDMKEAIATQYLHRPVSAPAADPSVHFQTERAFLQCPSHPINTTLCAKIAIIPAAFRELILLHYMSSDLAFALADFHVAMQLSSKKASLGSKPVESMFRICKCLDQLVRERQEKETEEGGSRGGGVENGNFEWEAIEKNVLEQFLWPDFLSWGARKCRRKCRMKYWSPA